MKRGLTEAERAAIYLHIYDNFQDWKQLYIIAHGAQRFEKLTVESKKNAVTRWKNSAFVVQEIESINKMREAERLKIIEEHERRKETEGPEGVATRSNSRQTDFLDRDEFLKFLNDRANDKQLDDKTRNDILKMLSDNLRYKDADKNEIDEIQRFYTPITCKDCEIYRRCSGCSGCSVAADA